MIVTRKRLLGAALGAAAGAQALPARAALNFATATTLGIVGPFTGDDRHYGEQMERGVRAAIDEANRYRGTFDGVFNYQTFDDQDLLAAGIVNAQFAIDNQSIVAVIGHHSGRITQAVVQKYAQASLPLVVPASSFDGVTAMAYPGILRLPTKDSFEGDLAAQYVIKANAPKTVALLAQDGDYGIDVASGARGRFAAEKIATVPFVFSWDKPNFAAVAAQVAAAKPDVVYLAGLVKDMGGVVPALRAAGYAGPLVGSQGFFDGATIATLGANAEGLVVSSSMPPLVLAPTVVRLVNDFQSQFGTLTPLEAFCYAAAQIVMTAARRIGSNDRHTLAQALTPGIPYNTIVGTFTFSPTGDPIDPNVYFYSVERGTWRYVRAAHPSSFVLR